MTVAYAATALDVYFWRKIASNRTLQQRVTMQQTVRFLSRILLRIKAIWGICVTTAQQDHQQTQCHLYSILRFYEDQFFSHRLYLLRPFEYLVLDYVLESYMRTGMYGGAYAEPHAYAVRFYDLTRWCLGRHLHRDTMRELPARPYRAVLWALPVQLADQPARRFETWICWIWPNHKTWLAPPSLPWTLFIGFLGAKSRSLCAWQKASIW